MIRWILLPFRLVRLGLYGAFSIVGHILAMPPLLALAWYVSAKQPQPFAVFLTGGVIFFLLNRFAWMMAKWLAPRDSWKRFRLPRLTKAVKPQRVMAVRARAPRGASPTEKQMWRRLPAYMQNMASS